MLAVRGFVRSIRPALSSNSHAGQSCSVCWAESRSDPQWSHYAVSSPPIRFRPFDSILTETTVSGENLSQSVGETVGQALKLGRTDPTARRVRRACVSAFRPSISFGHRPSCPCRPECWRKEIEHGPLLTHMRSCLVRSVWPSAAADPCVEPYNSCITYWTIVQLQHTTLKLMH